MEITTRHNFCLQVPATPWLYKAYCMYSYKDGVTTAHVCPNGTVFNWKSGKCKIGSYMFSARCQLYFSSLEWSEGYDFSEGMKGCQYPRQRFSSESATCENFTDVTCGTRHVEKEGCKYCIKMQRSECIFLKHGLCMCRCVGKYLLAKWEKNRYLQTVRISLKFYFLC